MALDPKVKNLLKFLVNKVLVAVVAVYLLFRFAGIKDIFQLIGVIVVAVGLWRGLLSIYRRMILPPKDPRSYGKWAIVTGTTNGIGKEFAEHLAKIGMSVVVISRNEESLKKQCEEIKAAYSVPCRYLAYDFTDMGEARTKFYSELDKVCSELDADGGIGILVNNVGMANEIPMNLEEFSDSYVDNIINCNIFSTVHMSRTVMKYMKQRKSGGIISISSGSGNHPGPFLAIYSATKAFMTQFSRSMHVECWGTGVDFLVVTPFYIVSNLYKRKSGSLLAPMPSELVKGTFMQLGKRYIWQGHGYWFHGLLGIIATYYWGAADRYRKMMTDNRRRYDERQQKSKEN